VWILERGSDTPRAQRGARWLARPASCRAFGEVFTSIVRPVSKVAAFWRCLLRRVDLRDAGTLSGVTSRANIALRPSDWPVAALAFFLGAFFGLADPARSTSYLNRSPFVAMVPPEF
jgi:hypothetical protein